MASSLLSKTFKTPKTTLFNQLSRCQFTSISAAQQPRSDDQSSSSSFEFTDAAAAAAAKDVIHLKSKPPNSDSKLGIESSSRSATSVTMPMSFMTGSIVGRRFYQQVTTRESDDGVGWTVMLDYRTLKTPCKRPLKLPTLGLAKAIAAEWEYQQADGIRPFTMPLMKLACTALERVPLTRSKIIENLMKKFNQDLVFCRAPEDSDTYARQVEKIDPLLDWVKAEFGYKPVVYSCFFGGKQEEGLVKVIENLLKKTNGCELATIDAIASSAHSLIIAIGIVRGKLGLEESIELIRVEEDLQVSKWGLVEGGHDIDVADLKAQVSSAAVFLGLSRT